MNKGQQDNLSKQRRIIIIAGSNGAGKTTFAREFLPKEVGCPVFVNADLIAAGLAPFQPTTAAIKAGRLMIEEMESYVRERRSFAFETTLSGRRYARMTPRWQSFGYRIKLVFLYLQDVRIAIERVRVRVRQGGHDVPEDVIRRRYEAGWRNFQQIYRKLVDTWVLYDNSEETPLLMDAGGEIMKGNNKTVVDEDLAKVGTALRRAAKQARKTALQTNTPLIIYENGRVIKKTIVREKQR
jgi:predicted ABC-type ATPase